MLEDRSEASSSFFCCFDVAQPNICLTENYDTFPKPGKKRFCTLLKDSSTDREAIFGLCFQTALYDVTKMNE